MPTTCKIQPWYNKQRIKKNGNASLYIEIVVSGEHPSYIPLEIDWPADKFDWEKREIRARFKDDPDITCLQDLSRMFHCCFPLFASMPKRFAFNRRKQIISLRDVNYRSSAKNAERVSWAIYQRGSPGDQCHSSDLFENRAGPKRGQLYYDVQNMQVL